MFSFEKQVAFCIYIFVAVVQWVVEDYTQSSTKSNSELGSRYFSNVSSCCTLHIISHLHYYSILYSSLATTQKPGHTIYCCFWWLYSGLPTASFKNLGPLAQENHQPPNSWYGRVPARASFYLVSVFQEHELNKPNSRTECGSFVLLYSTCISLIVSSMKLLPSICTISLFCTW